MRQRTRPADTKHFFDSNVRVCAPAAHIWVMKPLIDLTNSPWPQVIECYHTPPARRALDAGLVTKSDLLRLKVIARLHARGLPPDIGWADLLQEAFARVLDGSRHQPEDVPVVAFLAGVMRSIKEQYWRQCRRSPRRLPKLLVEFELADQQQDGPLDPQPSQERRVIAAQEMEAINKLFEDDVQAKQVISSLYEGCTPGEACAI